MSDKNYRILIWELMEDYRKGIQKDIDKETRELILKIIGEL